MKPIRFALAALACALLSLSSSAQGIGSKLPEVELEDFSQTKAKSLEDFTGRAVLIEFFAYW